MKAIEAVEKLEKSKEFASWRKESEKSYLVHCFKMLDKENEKIWQIGYFNPETNLISVFVVSDKITRNPDSEVFKEQEKLVNPLVLKDVKVDYEEALSDSKKIIDEKYKSSSVFKSFMILQNIDKIGQVWNMTFVTQQFKTINIKIDAKTGKCVSDKMISLISEMK